MRKLLISLVAALASLSAAAQVPVGMTLVWADEFNGKELDTTKWSTNYYSQLQYANKALYNEMMADKLPQPVYRMTGSSIVLITGDHTPERGFEGGRKVSSIQTYDWRSDKLLFDNSRGGYIEARIKRTAAPDATKLNGAFWLDSPGPDSRYFVEKGNTALGVEGVRPRGQLFEIDLCEMMNVEIVLHGDVSPEGKFQHNLEHYPLKGDFRDRWVTHGMLWTPAGLKFYVDGVLRAESSDPNLLRAPNHAMNIIMGMYGAGGLAEMEVDYIRFYQWDLDGSSGELPNGSFNYGLSAWEGSATVADGGVQLAPGGQISQLIYLDNSRDYEMTFSHLGAVEATVENITLVAGTPENSFGKVFGSGTRRRGDKVRFSTTHEFAGDKKVVRLTFKNPGSQPAALDNIAVVKR